MEFLRFDHLYNANIEFELDSHSEINSALAISPVESRRRSFWDVSLKKLCDEFDKAFRRKGNGLFMTFLLAKLIIGAYFYPEVSRRTRSRSRW